MVLVDTSVWIEHFKSADRRLQDLLQSNSVLVHEMVIGELMLGRILQRDQVVEYLGDMPKAQVAQHDELLAFVSQKKLYEQGIGWVDCHLLASCKITPAATLWTLDKRLAAMAQTLHIAHSFELH
jgi:predicted nucleic acid-binding protein